MQRSPVSFDLSLCSALSAASMQRTPVHVLIISFSKNINTLPVFRILSLPHFPLSHFPSLRFPPAFSTPAISTPCILDCVALSIPAFSALPSHFKEDSLIPPFLGQSSLFPLRGLSFSSLPSFSYPLPPSPRSDHQVRLGGLISAVSFLIGIRPGRKTFLPREQLC